MTAQELRKNLIQTFGLDKLPETKQAELLESMGKVIYEGVFLRVMERLNDKQKEEFGRIIADSKSENDIMDFLESNLPSIDLLIDEEVEAFKSESAMFLRKIGA